MCTVCLLVQGPTKETHRGHLYCPQLTLLVVVVGGGAQDRKERRIINKVMCICALVFEIFLYKGQKLWNCIEWLNVITTALPSLK